MPRMKKFPDLNKLLYRKKPKRVLTPDEQWALMLPMTYSKH